MQGPAQRVRAGRTPRFLELLARPGGWDRALGNWNGRTPEQVAGFLIQEYGEVDTAYWVMLLIRELPLRALIDVIECYKRNFQAVRRSTWNGVGGHRGRAW